MGERTGIEWTDATWNPWHGCKKVSAGCARCYMYTEKKVYGQNPAVVVRSKTKFRDPLRWREPLRVFTCSWSDFFVEEADAWRPEAWDIIRQTPHLTYQILTKRPERIPACLPPDWGDGWPNVWLGVSAEDQEHFDARTRFLEEVPAFLWFVSAEPLLGRIDPYRRGRPPVHWVIVGGESGPGARACDVAWVRELVGHCRAQGIPVFVKQLGASPFVSADPTNPARWRLRDRKGGDMSEWPEDLRVREFPRMVAA